MPTEHTPSTSQFEFGEAQNEVIGSLARRMGLVGMVMMLFGILQVINGVTSIIISRNPQRSVAIRSECLRRRRRPAYRPISSRC
jgi:hypothetical protein